MVDKAIKKTADDILAISDIKTDTIFVEAWETEVTVTGLTKRQQIDIRNSALIEGEPDYALVQQGMFREGVLEPRFTDEQAARVFEKSADAVDTVLKRVLELSGMKPEDVKRKGAEFPS